MRIGLVQVASADGEAVTERRDRVADLLAGARGCDLVVLPELWHCGYFHFDSYAERAESLDGPTVQAASRWARELGCHLHIGSMLERAANGALHNTALLFGPDGAIVHRYRKVHVFGYESREAELLTPGTGVDVAQTALGPVGATTCYDLRFPELWRALVDAGAKLVITPAAWPQARLRHWQLFTETRAVEEQVILVACNAVGVQSPGVQLAGHSRVVDPWGEVVVEAGACEGVTTCEVSPDIVDNVRSTFPVLADRRIFAATTQSEPVPPAEPDPPAAGRTGITVQVAGSGQSLALEPERLLIAGYTGRDVASVEAHIEELEAIGVPRPATIPAFYELDPGLLTTDPVIEVDGTETSGEVEPVLIRHRSRYYLGVGSDHTDRNMERLDIQASKGACPKPLGATVAALPEDLGESDWNAIGVNSLVDDQLYQSGSLASLRPPTDVLARLAESVGRVDGDFVIFVGTLPLVTGHFKHGTRWHLELQLPDGTSLSHSYEVKRKALS